MEVFPVLAPVLHVAPLPRRPAIPPDVQRMYRDAPGNTEVHQIQVEARVVAQSVDVEEHGPGGAGRPPALAEEREPTRTREPPLLACLRDRRRVPIFTCA